MDSTTQSLTIFDVLDDERPRALVVEALGVRFEIPVECAREVVRQAVPTPMPGYPSFVEGLLNIRGLVVTVVGLAEVMSAELAQAETVPEAEAWSPAAPPLPAGPPHRAQTHAPIVILEHASRTVGVRVDAVLAVQPIDEHISGDTVRIEPHLLFARIMHSTKEQQ